MIQILEVQSEIVNSKMEFIPYVFNNGVRIHISFCQTEERTGCFVACTLFGDIPSMGTVRDKSRLCDTVT